MSNLTVNNYLSLVLIQRGSQCVPVFLRAFLTIIIDKQGSIKNIYIYIFTSLILRFVKTLMIISLVEFEYIRECLLMLIMCRFNMSRSGL